jgi:hypothetical protein
MKLRIRGNSLRLRLTQGEIRALAEQGVIEDRTEFPGGQALVYRLRSDKIKNEISARYDNKIMEIIAPESAVARWCATELVTLSASLPLASDELRIVLEKDFACLAPREGEDESDNFPHPLAGTGQTC